MAQCRRCIGVVLHAALFALVCRWVIEQSHAVPVAPVDGTTASVATVPSFEQWCEEMHFTEGVSIDPNELRVAYADFIFERFGSVDTTCKVVDEVIQRTTQPCNLLMRAYRRKISALRHEKRLKELLDTCDQLAAAFRDDTTTYTWYGVVVPRKVVVQAVALQEKSHGYERIGNFEKALELEERANAIYEGLLHSVEKEKGNVLRLGLVESHRLAVAELCEKMGRYEEALRHLKGLHAYLADPTNLVGIPHEGHPEEQAFLEAVQRTRDYVLPAAIERIEKKLRGESAPPEPVGRAFPAGQPRTVSATTQPLAASYACDCGCGDRASTVTLGAAAAADRSMCSSCGAASATAVASCATTDTTRTPIDRPKAGPSAAPRRP